MSFQSTVRRNYATGTVGEIVADGPLRAFPGRIASVTIDGNGNTNRVGRAFGYSAEVPATGTTLSNIEATAIVGGPNFFGILSNPKRYALQGTSASTLAPSLDLPQYTEGEFTDMGIMILELFNETTGAKNTAWGDGIAYVSTATTSGQNPLGLPLGALVSFTPGSPPTGFTVIPNARVTNAISYSASAIGALVSGLTKVQLTQ
jgi:hypothetical protein